MSCGTPCRASRERRSQLSIDQIEPHWERDKRNKICVEITEYLFIVPMISCVLRYT